MAVFFIKQFNPIQPSSNAEFLIIRPIDFENGAGIELNSLIYS